LYQLANPIPLGDDEDEAARAVRSILGQSDHRPLADGQQQKEIYLPANEASVPEDANKENSGRRQVLHFLLFFVLPVPVN